MQRMSIDCWAILYHPSPDSDSTIQIVDEMGTLPPLQVPYKVLRDFVAEMVRQRATDRLEQMEPQEVLDLGCLLLG